MAYIHTNWPKQATIRWFSSFYVDASERPGSKGREVFKPLLSQPQNPSWWPWLEKKNEGGQREDQLSKGHHRRRAKAIADAKKGKIFIILLGIEFRASPHPYQSKNGSRWAKNTSKAPLSCHDCNLKTSVMTPFLFPVLLNFLTILFLVLFWCILAEEKRWLRRRNNRAAAPKDPYIGRVSVFPFSSQQRPPNLVFHRFSCKTGQNRPKLAKTAKPRKITAMGGGASAGARRRRHAEILN